MHVNEFSFPSEKFFMVSSFNSHPVEFARGVLGGKNQERRRLAGRLVQSPTEGPPRKWLVQNCCGILCHAVGIVSENPRHVALVENLVSLF
jgi:hypothetical protein